MGLETMRDRQPFADETPKHNGARGHRRPKKCKPGEWLASQVTRVPPTLLDQFDGAYLVRGCDGEYS